ncbi:MAG TPA: RDD family protein [Chitinophagaceae bacterium]|jgi:RDD family.
MNTIEANAPDPEQLFTNLDEFNYEEASSGQRFLNYLIDTLLMQYGMSFITGFLLGKLLLAISPELAYDLFVVKSNNVNTILSLYLISTVNYLIYYTFCEKLFKGYSLGKLITGTRAIREDGQELTLKNAFLRSLSRLVPFEPFSIWFGSYGLWHDAWTKTIVIKSR